MKKTILFVLVLMSVVPMFGQNIFTDGAVWKVKRAYAGGVPEEKTTQDIEYRLSEIESEAETAVFNLNQNQTIDGEESVVVCRIKEDDNRVYFQQGPSDEWKLLYDFNLELDGEVCVCMPTFDIWNPGEGRECVYVRCVGDGIIETNGMEWPILYIDEYSDPDYKRFMGSGIWIKGIGSINGLIENCRFNYIMGMGSRLAEVIYNDEVIYSYPYTLANIDAIRIKDLSISCNGSTISISEGPINAEVSVFNIDGGKVAQAKSSEDGCCISVGSPGVYIVKVGDMARKVLVK